MRFIKKLVELYVFDYLKTKVKIEDIVKLYISDFVRQNHDMSKKVKEEVDKYIEDQMTERNIKNIVYFATQYVIKDWIYNGKTFAQIGAIMEQTVESNDHLKSLAEQELTPNEKLKKSEDSKD